MTGSASAVDGDWATTTAIKYGALTLPGPGNLPAILKALEKQFDWVAKWVSEFDVNENGSISPEDILFFILHADKATSLFTHHFDIGPVLESMNLDFPLDLLNSVLPNWNKWQVDEYYVNCTMFSVCEFETFQEAAHQIGDVINDKIVKFIQYLTTKICGNIRTTVLRGISQKTKSSN